MQIKIKIAKILSDVIDTEKEEFMVELAPESSIADLIDTLAINEKELPFIVYLVNGSNARRDTILKDGDFVKILPILAGG